MEPSEQLFAGPYASKTSTGTFHQENFEIFSTVVSKLTNPAREISQYTDKDQTLPCKFYGGLGAGFTDEILSSVISDFLKVRSIPEVGRVHSAVKKISKLFLTNYSECSAFIGVYPQWQGFTERHGNATEEKNPLNFPIAFKGAKQGVSTIADQPVKKFIKFDEDQVGIELNADLFCYHRDGPRDQASVFVNCKDWTQVCHTEGAKTLSELTYFLFNTDLECDLKQRGSSTFPEPAWLDNGHGVGKGMAAPMITVFGLPPNGMVHYVSFLFSPRDGTLFSIRQSQSATSWAKILGTSMIVRELFIKASQCEELS